MKNYTIAEISRQTDIPESTLRYRTKLFKKYIPTIGKGRRRRFTSDSIERFKMIDDFFSEGIQTDDIVQELEKKYGPEVTLHSSKTKKEIIQKANSSIDIEMIGPILKVIENQEIIINELRVQNKMLQKPQKKSLLSKIFS
jgi:DNA-binding transcriptional MerR regulator